MAILSDENRFQVWADVMRLERSQTGTWSADKNQVRAALNAADVEIDNQLVSFQNSIPEPIRTNGPSHVLLANSVAIARGSSFDDASAGIANRDQSALILSAYNGASTWLTANVGALVTAVITASQGTLTQAQALLVIEKVCRKRATV